MADVKTPAALIGGDRFQRARIVERAAKAAYGNEEPEILTFWADEGGTQAALEEVQSQSLFADTRVIVLRNVDAALGPRARKSAEGAHPRMSEADLKALTDCVRHPPGGTPFFLTAESAQPFPKALRDALGRDGIVQVPQSTRGDIQKSAERLCQKAGVSIEGAAMRYFLDSCNDDAELAANEIRKLTAWAAPGETITLEVAKDLLVGEREEKAWALLDAIRAKKPLDALGHVRRMAAKGQEPIVTLAMLVTVFRNIHQCKCLLEDKIPPSKHETVTNLRGGSLRANLKNAEAFTLPQLRRALARLRQADEDLKGGKPDPELALEGLAMDLCRL